MKRLNIDSLFYNSSMKYDVSLLWTVISLISIGILMISSASISIYESNSLFYFNREFFQLLMALSILFVIVCIPIEQWKKYSSILFVIIFILLIVVLFVGSSIKGASRWIPLGIFNFQPSELSKLVFFCYLASYLSRKKEQVQTKIRGFLKPFFLLIIYAACLLIQPDLGTVIVLLFVTVGILFIVGARLWQFIISLIFVSLGISYFIFFEPYRLTRFITFLDPWKDPTGAGYQLTGSLMAIGNGGLWGQGLGNSVRKLGYLPEAHTDFIFSIMAEEIGYIGIVVVLILLFYLSFKALLIGYRVLNSGNAFAGYLACEIGIWFGFQTFVNVGVTSGLLPTKGLTLPFISYGGSSLIVMSIAVALLLRIDFEFRQSQIQARIRIKK